MPQPTDLEDQRLSEAKVTQEASLQVLKDRVACYKKHVAEGLSEKHAWWLAYQEYPKQ